MDALSQLNSALAARYQIEREIGRGGMAVVYLARDLRHQRKVALKLLNPELGAVLGVERFLSEIQVTANLQHPNLLPLFDSGEVDGLLYYVMPFIEGESLRARLRREKQLPLDDVLHIAIGVGSALDYAHRHKVIHRDLKPENILLHEGEPLVADFGIALAVSIAGGERITQTGISLGTPHYMSPEQATGDREIDGRTDIYSLGAVVYEMLTGDPPHSGTTAQAIIAKVITDRPRSIRLSRDTVPEHVEAAVDRALAKLPADRWHTAHDFTQAMQGRGVALPSGAQTPGTFGYRAPPARRTNPFTSAAVWVAVLAVAAGAALWGWLRPAPAAPVVRFALPLAANERLAPGVPQPIGISPDGRTVVYSAHVSGTGRQLYTRAMGELRPRALTGTENAASPMISPDGKWVAFVALGKLRKVPIEGGPATTLADAPESWGLAWLSNDELVFSRTSVGLNLWRVSSRGGDAAPYFGADSANSGGQIYPYADPGTGLVFYTSIRRGLMQDGRLAVLSPRTGRSKMLAVSGTQALGIVLNHLVYVREDGVLLAAPFNAGKLEVTGSPIPLEDGVQVTRAGAAAAISRTGTLLFVRGSSTSQPTLVDDRGVARTFLPDKRRYAHPRFSPDGRRVVFDVTSPQGTDLWVADMGSGTFTRLTSRGNNERPEWMQRGERIVYPSDRDSAGFYSIWSMPSDGSAQPERMFTGPFSIREVVPSPDGQFLIYREDNSQTRRDIHLLPTVGARSPRPLLTTGFDELMPRISPNGKWLAYMSDETGQYEIYVRSLPGPGGRFQVSTNGGTEPLWSRDGRRLFYRQGTQLIAASIATTPSLSVSTRTVILDGLYETHPFHPNYDVSPDAKHFLMLKTADDDTQIVAVVNWLDELRHRTRNQ